MILELGKALPELDDTQLRTLRVDAEDTLDLINDTLVLFSTNHDSLTSGNLGLLTYYFTLYKTNRDEVYGQKAANILYEVFERLNEKQSMPTGYSYSSGISGLCRCIRMLTSDGLLPGYMVDEITVFDDVLCDQAEQMIVDKKNDFFHSSLGILAYFSSRVPDHEIGPKVERLLRLFLGSVHETDEFCWIDNILPAREKEPLIDLSLAHGQCSFLLLLLDLYVKGLRSDRMRQVIVKGIEFILSTYRTIGTIEEHRSVFPSMINLEGNMHVFSNRLAWCYGDLNKVYLLYKAGYALKESRYISIAATIGENVTTRTSFEQTLCKDSIFCHGSSGLAQFYNTLYQLHPTAPYKNAYHFWIRQTVELLKGEIPIDYHHQKETQFLEGLVGPAFVLLSFFQRDTLSWPSLFLLEPHIPL